MLSVPCFRLLCLSGGLTICLWNVFFSGGSEGTAIVTFEVLIINCHIVYTFFHQYCLFKTSNINLFIFNCLNSNFCFPKNISFATRTEGCLYTCALSFDFELARENVLLRNTNKFLKYRTLCTSILKYGLATKGIKLTRFVLFEALGAPQL